MESLTKFSRLVSHILLTIGAVALAVMMFLTMLDVALRYVFSSPLTGVNEILEYLMAMLVAFGIVYCAHRKSHVSVDVLFDLLSKGIQKVVTCIMSLIILCLFLLVAWQNIIYIIETYESKLTTSVLYIPTYPFVGAIALGFTALWLVLLVDFVNFLSEAFKN